MAGKEEQNKEFYLKYLSTLSGNKKTRELIEQFVADDRLINHILFFENLFPEYELILQELMAEGDRIFVRAQFMGTHAGETEGIPSTMQKVETPFATGYKIKDHKIVDFWAIANELELFEQMGLTKDEVNVKEIKGK